MIPSRYLFPALAVIAVVLCISIAARTLYNAGKASYRIEVQEGQAKALNNASKELSRIDSGDRSSVRNFDRD